ncbi:MAG: alpha/beta hydrolase [Rhodococcus sp.]|nr:alpha/beta hydrolase [Rhodococcus sp. (in: high G+C Gram-positive bacteria)]
MTKFGPGYRERASTPRLDFVHGRHCHPDLVIVAHGGQENSYADTHARLPAILRMWPFVHAAHVGAPAAAVALLRYRFRGWNGEHSHPLEDLRTILRELPDDVRRVVLVGHSMGARTVMQCADDPRVKGVLALAPWLPDTEPIPSTSTTWNSDTLIVTAHGTRDRVTGPMATSTYVRRLRQAGHAAAEFRVRGEGHALLERHGDWDELVRRFVTSVLGTTVDPVLAHASTKDPTHAPDELPAWSDGGGRTAAVMSIVRAGVKASVPRSIVGE